MTPELKLKVAVEDIKVILKKYDIAASIVLHTPGHAEYLLHLLTSYSCAYQYNDQYVRLHSKLSDHNGDVELLLKKQSETANMLTLLSKVSIENLKFLIDITQKMDQLTGAVHSKNIKMQ